MKNHIFLKNIWRLVLTIPAVFLLSALLSDLCLAGKEDIEDRRRQNSIGNFGPGWIINSVLGQPTGTDALANIERRNETDAMQAKIEQKVKKSAGEVVTPELKKKRSGPEPSKQNTNTLKTVIDDPNFIDQQMADAIIDTANQQTGSVKLHMDACNVQITLRDGKIWLTIVSNSGKSSQYSIIGRLEEESLDGKKPAHSRSGISLENAVTTSGDSFVIMLNEYYYDIANDKYRYTAEKQAILFQMNGNKLMTSATYLLRNQFFYNSKTGAYYYQASDWSVEKDTESPSSFYLNIANRQIGNGMAISDTPAGQKAVQNQANKPEDKLLNDNPSDAVKESSLKNRSIDDESKMPSLGVYGKNGTASGDIKQYGQADRDKEVTGEAQDPAKNGHPRPFDNFLEININSNDKLEGFMSALRNKEGKTEVENEMIRAAETLLKGKNYVDEKTILEFEETIRIVEAASAIKDLFSGIDFGLIKQAFTGLAEDSTRIYDDYAKDTAKLYEKLKDLLGVAVNKETPDSVEARIEVDTLLSKLRRKDVSGIKDNEKAALALDETALKPLREKYAANLKSVVKDFISVVKKILNDKNPVSIEKDSNGLKALFLLDRKAVTTR